MQDLNYYTNVDIIGWLYYNQHYEMTFNSVNRVCYVYPLAVIKSDKFIIIDPADFPDYGRIEVKIQGGKTAEDIFKECGSLVSIRINEALYPNLDANNKFSLKYNPLYGKKGSEIWIESFNCKNYYQLIDLQNKFNVEDVKKYGVYCEEAPKTPYILLQDEGKFIGPFEYTYSDQTLYVNALKENKFYVGEYYNYDYESEILSIRDQDDRVAVNLLNKHKLLPISTCKISYDCIDMIDLLDELVNTITTNKKYSREEKRVIKDYVQLVEKEKNYFNEDRYERLQKIDEHIKNTDSYNKFVEESILYAISDGELKDKEKVVIELVKKYLDDIKDKISYSKVLWNKKMPNKILDNTSEDIKSRSKFDFALSKDNNCFNSVNDQFLKQTTKQIDALSTQVKNLTAERDRLKEKIKDKNESLESLNKDKRALQNEKEQISGKLNTIESIKEEIGKLKEERDKLKEENKSIKQEQDKLLDEKEQLEKEKDALKQGNKEIEDNFIETLDIFNNRAKQAARILDEKIVERILRGFNQETDKEEMKSFNKKLLHPSIKTSKIIERVGSFIRNKAHRNVTNNDVANYLICITQGFITTFAGEPGTGKTSLCNILAKALGLYTNNENNRFIEVSVERGWTSYKDFIGYYNPLTKNIEKSNVDVFNAFKQMDYEVELNSKDAEVAPVLILLDEANLSPIEHYWASFLKDCDVNSSSAKTLPLGGDCNFKIPSYLRFLATVNFDHTTEELSPRFLDRSFIINLDPNNVYEGIDDNVDNCGDMISFESIKNAFAVKKSDTIDGAVVRKWETLQEIFKSKECSLPIMPRSLKMVNNYCAVACKCMDTSTPSTKLSPLDYAFSQKILPTINGSGENYKYLINELLKECTNDIMPITFKHLQRMQRVAENNMGFYQFFAR